MITHIFKNGATTNDITGHLVKRTDCPTAYEIMEGINADKRKDVQVKEQGCCQEAQGKDGQVIGDQGKTPGRS